eukprot:Tbor_TRINITY_DN6113_c2_g11::TRINITY_DN6113_c2_g11_i1::g.22750::m.22750
MDPEADEYVAEVADIPGNSLGLFLLDILSFLDAGNERTMQAICPMVRGLQELMIDRHDFGLVWTTAPDRKVGLWVRHGGGHDSAESGRILMGISETEHWATAEPCVGTRKVVYTNITCHYPIRINPRCRLRALIVNLRVIAEEGLMPECVTSHDDGEIWIGDGFLATAEAASVYFVGAEDVVHIGCLFLCGSTVQYVDLHGFERLSFVGYEFLSYYTALTSVSFDSLRSLTRVWNGFLQRCTSLTTVSFNGLGSLTTIGHLFLSGCTSLTNVSFVGLNCLTKVGYDFLCECTSLTTV